MLVVKEKSKTSIIEKYKIVKEVEKGESYTSTSIKYGAPKQTLSGWLTTLLQKESGCDSPHMTI